MDIENIDKFVNIFDEAIGPAKKPIKELVDKFKKPKKCPMCNSELEKIGDKYACNTCLKFYD